MMSSAVTNRLRFDVLPLHADYGTQADLDRFGQGMLTAMIEVGNGRHSFPGAVRAVVEGFVCLVDTQRLFADSVPGLL